MTVAHSVYGVVAMGALAALMQAAPVVDPSSINAFSRLGADGLLAAAVVVLWRKLQEKDSLLMQNYARMAEALAANKSVNDKMSETLDAMKQAVGHLTSVALEKQRQPPTL